MHPDLARAHVTAWEDREKRPEFRAAAIQLVAAQCAGNKKVKLLDFLPSWCKPKRKIKTPEEQTAYLKEAFADFIIKPTK